MKDSKLWCVSEADLRMITPERARDLIIECFFDAQRETFARAKASLGSSTDEASIRKSVVQGVKLAFREAGYDFDHPSLQALVATVEVLARKAVSWGTPADVVAHHRVEVGRVITALQLQS